ncbi:glycosyltransferase family 4 protein [Bacillus horti]|uniref:Glycosyltransferase involved in cell wall biosynthesis n=1 Tax=Caldalkalibacillus horti TaxID=77523 RepID=A0ABT9VVI5_9BACI|nr:glycosyltransferase family 4 protein [Bacillus horti]MDQ0165009.1 glycosyltransferase involved in cell wall biosynthesis [Bacillus horti]
MKILVFSMATIMKDVSMGGSQRHLRELLFHLADQGHQITVLTNRRQDNSEEYELCPGVQVLPILRFKETFPIPYDTHPFHLAHSYSLIRQYADTHDVFYIHDAQMDYGYLHANIPTVASIKNFVYPEAMISAFHTNRNYLIVSCDYMYSCIQYTVGRVQPQITDQLRIVKNGVDLSVYKPVEATRKSQLGLTDDDFVLLFPHRPEASKGIVQAFETVRELKEKLKGPLKGQLKGKARVRLLLPRHFDVHVSKETEQFYTQLTQEAKEFQVEESLVFYPWVPGHDMPQLYAIADVTLCIGQFIESFGYVQIESIACGTPVVVSNVGAQRSIVPSGYSVIKVDYGDTESTVEAIAELASTPMDITGVRQFLDQNYNYKENLLGYEELITSAGKGSSSVFSNTSLKSGSPMDVSYKLAPWCYVSGPKKGIYHDYFYTYLNQHELYSFLSTCTEESFSQMELVEAGVSSEAIEKAIEDGILVLYTP